MSERGDLLEWLEERWARMAPSRRAVLERSGIFARRPAPLVVLDEESIYR